MDANKDVIELLSSFSLIEGAEVVFGGVDGSIVRTPSISPPPGDCVMADSRLL